MSVLIATVPGCPADAANRGARARANGKAANVMISSAFGCPYEGEVKVERVVQLAEQVLEVLRTKGHDVVVREPWASSMGHAHAIEILRDAHRQVGGDASIDQFPPVEVHRRQGTRHRHARPHGGGQRDRA